jgi:hypothetical protein
MSRLNLRPGRHVWFVGMDGKAHQGTITHRVDYMCGDQAYIVQISNTSAILVNTGQIRAGEIRRCEFEMARAQAEIATDEGALLGYRDWKQEKELLEK